MLNYHLGNIICLTKSSAVSLNKPDEMVWIAERYSTGHVEIFAGKNKLKSYLLTIAQFQHNAAVLDFLCR